MTLTETVFISRPSTRLPLPSNLPISFPNRHHNLTRNPCSLHSTSLLDPESKHSSPWLNPKSTRSPPTSVLDAGWYQAELRYRRRALHLRPYLTRNEVREVNTTSTHITMNDMPFHQERLASASCDQCVGLGPDAFAVRTYNYE